MDLKDILLEADEKAFARSIHKTSRIVVKTRFGAFKECSAYLYELPDGNFRSIGYWPLLGPIIGPVVASTIKGWILQTHNYLDHDRAITKALIKKGLI